MGDKINDRVSYLYSRDPSIDRRYRPRPERKVNLFAQISEEAGDVSSETSTTSNSDRSDTASVYLRLRPTSKKLLPQYSFDRNVFKTRPADLTSAQKDIPEKQFTFTNIFNDQTSQAGVYNSCCFDAIENEENLTVLTYGTSGSGKTFTLLGLHSENPGIIPRAIEHIFTKNNRNVCGNPVIKLDKGNVVIVEDVNFRVEANIRNNLISRDRSDNYIVHKQRIQSEHEFKESECPEGMVVVWVSFAEIYNEHVYDLLASPEMSTAGKDNNQTLKRKNLKIISNDGNAFIKDLRSVHCRNSNDAYQLLATGLKQVAYASTNINSNSSRSHCIFIIEVIHHKNQYEFNHFTYKFCDLAGSERQKKTDNIGNRLKEAQSINNSLMVLGRCLDAVYHNQSIVPIRDSKLTVLLQASLLGKEKITMIVNMMPTMEYYEENLNVLNFASMAKQIVYKAPVVARKNQRSSRFSWFISHAASSSSPKASGVNNLGDDSQISFLLDENDRLKQDLETVMRLNENLQGEIERREMEIKRELIAEHDQRMKRSEDLWNKRMEHKAKTCARDLEYELEKVNTAHKAELIVNEKNYQKAIKHQQAVWESKFAEIETTIGKRFDRPTSEELNDFSILEPTIEVRDSLAPRRTLDQNASSNDSFIPRTQDNTVAETEEDDDCSIVEEASQPPINGMRNESKNESITMDADLSSDSSDDDDCSIVDEVSHQSPTIALKNESLNESTDDDCSIVSDEPRQSMNSPETAKKDPIYSKDAPCADSSVHIIEQPTVDASPPLNENAANSRQIQMNMGRKSEADRQVTDLENQPPEKRNRISF